MVDQETKAHEYWMRRCLALAARGQSPVYPNPRVGAVVVSEEGVVLGEGWHARRGEGHAEPTAIADALQKHGNEAIHNATIYVNLEPCSHTGRTPPCTQAVLKQGIPRVVVGMADPNPRAAGGADVLRSHGVQVTMGVLEEACKRLNEPFLHSLCSTRPLVMLKIAQTLDGRVATSTGHSQWITGRPARRRVHAWRADTDGILTGSGTARADNPSLTVRHVQGPNPRRFVLDRKGALPSHLHLFSDGVPTTAIVGPEARPAYAEQLQERGGAILRIPEKDGHLDLQKLIHQLGVHTLMVEAGPRLATALLRKDLVDRLFVFVAPKVLGGGMASVDGLNFATMDRSITFAGHTWEQVGDDLLFCGYLRSL